MASDETPTNESTELINTDTVPKVIGQAALNRDYPKGYNPYSVPHSSKDHMKDVFFDDGCIAQYNNIILAANGRFQFRIQRISVIHEAWKKLREIHQGQCNELRYKWEFEYSALVAEHAKREEPFHAEIETLLTDMRTQQRTIAKYQKKKRDRKRVLERVEVGKVHTKIGKALNLVAKRKKMNKIFHETLVKNA